MKSVSLSIAAALLPLAALAQSNPLGNLQCLPAAQQEEAKTKAQAILADIEARRSQVQAAFGPGLTLFDAQARRNVIDSQLRDCARDAKRKGQSTLEACERPLIELRVMAAVIDQLDRNPQAKVDVLASEEKIRLEGLRAKFPSCSQTVADKG